MFSEHRDQFYDAYHDARTRFIREPKILVDLEHWLTDLVCETISETQDVLKRDYDEASYLYPFWQNYPPENRGRSPRGDQIPWIEVGEHAVGANLLKFVGAKVLVREVGLPSGPDQRFAITDDRIEEICGFTDSVMLFLDIKSVGPRDDFDHTVLSPYQVSGDGKWGKKEAGVRNSVVKAIGERASHDFHLALPPVYVFSDGTVAPTLSLFIKPRYDMLMKGDICIGQPLMRVTVVSLPNGLLLTENPNYLRQHPGLFFPGKDDKSKDAKKVRARVSFRILRGIAPWRVQAIDFIRQH